MLATDKALIVMPLFHLGGKIEQMGFSLMGAPVVLKAAFDPDDILRTIEKERVTAAHFAPAMVGRLLDALEAKPHYDVSTLRCVHYASGADANPAVATRDRPDGADIRASLWNDRMPVGHDPESASSYPRRVRG